jgi:hypothetical protein
LVQLKQVIADIPQDARAAVEAFIASERKRLAEMRQLEATVQTQLGQQVALIATELPAAFNPENIKPQLSTALVEGGQAVVEIVQTVLKTGQPEAVAQIIEHGPQRTKPVTETVPVISTPVTEMVSSSSWLNTFVEQNKTWLPLAIGGTVGLGLLISVGTRLKKKTVQEEQPPQQIPAENKAV